jgi:hypothetical protein
LSFRQPLDLRKAPLQLCFYYNTRWPHHFEAPVGAVPPTS